MTTDFAGLPVSGDIRYAEPSVEQRPKEEFYTLLIWTLGAPDVAAIYWNQYTPYFNDGEACEFGTGEMTVDFHSIPSREDPSPWERGWNITDPHVTGGPVVKDYDSAQRKWVPTGEVFERHAAADALIALARSFQYHQDTLLQAFGDHAEVTVTSKGITVEHFEHD